MRIDKIKVNGFGKIKNREIELKDGINIIYGENEAGKSTLLKCIEASLYGLSKNKNGKEKSDFDKYKPWDESEFSTKITYTLDNNENYELFREYKRKSGVVYKDGNDISKEFITNKTTGIQVLEEQIGVDEYTFCHTAMISQQEVKLEKSDTNGMIQKISNLVSSGDDNLSYKKSIDKLIKLQNENVGTDRTKQKPINIVNEQIEKLLEEKKSLQFYKQNIYEKNKHKNEIDIEINKLQEKKEKLKNKMLNINEDKVKEIENKLKKKISLILLVVLFIVTVVLCIFEKSRIFSILPIIFAIIDVIFILKIKSCKNGNELILEKIKKELEDIETKINDLKVESKILENEKSNIDEKLEKLIKIEENLAEKNREKEELLSLNISYNIAKEALEKVYDEIRNNISPKFEQKLCEISEVLTDGKYKNIKLNDENELCVEIENGIHIPVENLSIGTIDEMYLSLRLSMLSEISKENLPILLDETFVYFDNERLKNILCYLQDKNYNNQIIIFTCSNREEQILNGLRIEYNKVNLEKINNFKYFSNSYF